MKLVIGSTKNLPFSCKDYIIDLGNLGYLPLLDKTGDEEYHIGLIQNISISGEKVIGEGILFPGNDSKLKLDDNNQSYSIEYLMNEDRVLKPHGVLLHDKER